MFKKIKFLTFFRKLFRQIKRKFTKKPHPVEVDRFEYNENKSPFNCEICLLDINPADGLILKDCIHRFCKACIINTIKYSTEAEIRCPHPDCLGVITDREIRCFISYEDYDVLLDRSLRQAEISMKASYHCKTLNCIGWVEVNSKKIERFRCQVCMKINCIPCQAVHESFTCRQYREEWKMEIQQSKRLIETLMKEKKIKKCPKCNVLIEKNLGCDHIKCIKCQQDFQWSSLQKIRVGDPD